MNLTIMESLPVLPPPPSFKTVSFAPSVSGEDSTPTIPTEGLPTRPAQSRDKPDQRPSLSREFPTDKSQLVKSSVSCQDQTEATRAALNKTELLLPKSEIVPIKLKNSYK